MREKKRRRSEAPHYIYLAISPEDNIVRHVVKKSDYFSCVAAPCGKTALQEWLASEKLAENFGENACLQDDLTRKIAEDLRSDLLQRLHFVKKSGKLATGFETIRPLLAKPGHVEALLQASDGSEKEKRRLTGNRDGIAIELFDASELGSIIARQSCCHMAILRGGAKTWRESYERYKTYIDG